MIRLKQFGILAAAAAAATVLASCGKPGGGQAPAADAGASISGAGATFPAPLYARWAQDYQQQVHIGLNYQAIGSGGGIKQIEASTIDFGASDKPLTPEELDKQGLYQFPTVVGGVTPIVNVPGLKPGELKLSGALLGDIFLGAVSRWNDPRVKALNPGVSLPAAPITVVHRSDGSGTSFLFTTYLAAKNPTWSQKVGASDAVQWPAGLGGKGNDGVSAFVKQTVGSIGYVEYAYARQNGMTYVSLQDHDGAFVNPTAENFAAAAAGADWQKAKGNYLLLIDQPGANAWPITGATFILLHRRQADAGKAKAVLQFFDWAYRTGDQAASGLDYVALPGMVKDEVRRQWAEVTGPDGKPVFAP